MKKLAIYYGWPSAVLGSFSDKPGTIEDAISIFSGFDITILSDVLSEKTHGDHDNTLEIIKGVHKVNKIINGYVNLGMHPHYDIFTEDQLFDQLDRWNEMAMDGVLFDLLDPGYKAPSSRIKKISDATHERDLIVIYNADFEAVNTGWFRERIVPLAKEGDCILIEPFGTSWQHESYELPEKLPRQLRKLQRKGIKVIGVSTYDNNTINSKDNMETLIFRFKKYRQEAERLGLDAYQFTSGLYSSSGPDSNLLIDFEKITS